MRSKLHPRDRRLQRKRRRAQYPGQRALRAQPAGRGAAELQRRSPAARLRRRLYNRGNVLQMLGRYEESLADYGRAMALQPENADALNNRGNALLTLRRNPKRSRISTGCCESIPTTPMRGKAAARPDALLRLDRIRGAGGAACGRGFGRPALRDAVRVRRRLRFRRRSASLRADLGSRTTLPPGSRRSGGASATVTTGSGLLISRPISTSMRRPICWRGLFEQHDRSRFETIAVSFGPDSDSPMRARLSGAFDRFVDVRDRSDAEAAPLICATWKSTSRST